MTYELNSLYPSHQNLQQKYKGRLNATGKVSIFTTKNCEKGSRYVDTVISWTTNLVEWQTSDTALFKQ